MFESLAVNKNKKVMTFDSKSIMMNKGINYRHPIQTPSMFLQYKFAPDVLKKAVDEFNQRLKKRSRVTMQVKNVKADVLRVVPTGEDTLALWVAVKEKDVDTMNKIQFTIKGDVYFEGESEEKVDHMVIHDVMFDGDHGIFADKKK